MWGEPDKQLLCYATLCIESVLWFYACPKTNYNLSHGVIVTLASCCLLCHCP